MKTDKLLAVENWCALAEQAKFDPAKLVKLVGVHARKLQRFVHDRTGRSLRSCLYELRLRIAAQRLAGGATISELASALSFYDGSHFRRQFHDFFQCSPRKFVIEWKQHEARWMAQGGSASASISPSQELAKAVQRMETQLRSETARDPKPAHQPVRIALVDEDPSTVRKVQEAFALFAPEWQVNLHAPSEETVNRLAQARPVAVLLGCRKLKHSRFDCLVEFAAKLPDLPMVVWADAAVKSEILAALADGAKGYVLKPDPLQQLVEAIRVVRSGGTFLCEQAQEAASEGWQEIMRKIRSIGLTPREREIFLLRLARPKGKITEELNLSKQTVHAISKAISTKLKLHGSNELGCMASLR